ncbi:hypothetical protein IUY40_06175 [Flavobacterium sp. ALJ2]|uniref:hypothetical protein n=1 Tax=Flavobacterium sp. ALJ2 TaxID=2786960 RepID=UPI00189E4602|nr:hypothetical protein [Flavobacterium sp. ALJ2]MBF7091121.1 hypothetical protein [Flavobacterium sp. ALJ2]
MKIIQITEYNKKALEDVGAYIELTDRDKEPIIKKINFYNFTDMMCSVSAILEAIEVIGYNGNKENLYTCASLASVARKMLPSEEMEFLDRLLIKEDRNKDDFQPIKKL